MVPANIRVEIALIVGEIPKRIIEYIFNGNVVDPGPATKNVITKSSIDSVRDIKKAAKIPGNDIGIITLNNAISSVAPKSYAASIILYSKSWSLEKTIIRAYGSEKVTCAINIVNKLNFIFINTKKINKETPIIISGIIKGK